MSFHPGNQMFATSAERLGRYGENRSSIARVVLAVAFLYSTATFALAEQPTEKELLPLVETLTRTKSMGTVPAVPPMAEIKSVDAKILKIESAQTAIGRIGGKATGEFQVWPVKVFAVVNYKYAGQTGSHKGEGTYYAYKGPALGGAGVTDSQGKWTVTATPLEIKKSSLFH